MQVFSQQKLTARDKEHYILYDIFAQENSVIWGSVKYWESFKARHELHFVRRGFQTEQITFHITYKCQNDVSDLKWNHMLHMFTRQMKSPAVCRVEGGPSHDNNKCAIWTLPHARHSCKVLRWTFSSKITVGLAERLNLWKCIPEKHIWSECISC